MVWARSLLVSWRKSGASCRVAERAWTGGRMRAQGLAAFAVAVPALMGAVFAIVGIGFWLYAQLVVAGAAQEGARVAARETGTLVEGEDAARRFLAGSLGARGTGLPITMSEDADVVVVDVSGQFPVA